MMYEFPKIERIETILEVIKGKEEFIVCEKNGYKVINYVYKTDTTFPIVSNESDALLRECRGVMFDFEGRIIRRPFHKFFNVNERPETLENLIDFSQPHVILEKLDGSMITPFIIEKNGPIRWATKMGETDISAQVEAYLLNVKKMAYHNLIWECIQDNCTPIFEWCSRQNRVVIDHPEDKLVLTGIRNNWSGLYWSIDLLNHVAAMYGVPVVRNFNTSVTDIQKFIAETRSLQDIEGYVIRFDNGHMLKIKTDQYVLIHQTKDMINSERKIVDCIVNERLDDVIAILVLDIDKERVTKYAKKFWELLSRDATWLGNILLSYRKIEITRKDFALSNEMDNISKSILFSLWDVEKFDMLNTLQNVIKKNCGNNKNFMKVKEKFFSELEYINA